MLPILSVLNTTTKSEIGENGEIGDISESGDTSEIGEIGEWCNINNLKVNAVAITLLPIKLKLN